MRRISSGGFTLLELIIALALLAIIASVAIAKFVNLSEKAFQIQEESTIKSLRAALILNYTENCLAGDCHWYGSQAGEDDPFSLLENAPPHFDATAVPDHPWCDDGNNDDINWFIERTSPGGEPEQLIIWCPHANWWSTCSEGAHDNAWIYCYDGTSGIGCPEGSIIHEYDKPNYGGNFPGHQNLYAIRH